MSYFRVIPRDLFNEANLLKCLAKISLDIHDGKLPFMEVECECEGFQIEQNESTGGIYCTNVVFKLDGKPVHLERPLNSRKPWPLYLHTEDDMIEVFDEQGNVLLKSSKK